MNKEISLKEHQIIIDKWILDHGGYWSPLSMLSAIMEELGEVAKEINHIEGYKTKKPDEVPSSIGEELGDVIFAILCVANYYKIDINKELSLTIEKYSKRDSSRFK
jgi:NTP pyrophosphatase (non-canonical NTP hydrolase)